MVKNILSIIMASILIISCNCYRGARTEFGFPRRQIRPLDFISNYARVDTTCIYKRKIDFYYNSSTKSYGYYNNTDNNGSRNTTYLKFYPEGKFGLFVIAKTDTASLTRESFNPKRAKMGYYTVENGIIKTKLVTDGDCAIYISKKFGTIKGDTLSLDRNGHGSLYVKSKIPYSFLNWKPDW